MGVFANSTLESGRAGPLWLGPAQRKQEWHGQSGFDAMGRAVPAFRKAALYRDLKAQGWGEERNGVGGTEWCFRMVEMFADRVERDDSHGAMEEAYKRGMDAICVYRSLAVILAAAEPKPDPEPEPSYVDLVQ